MKENEQIYLLKCWAAYSFCFFFYYHYYWGKETNNF